MSISSLYLLIAVLLRFPNKFGDADCVSAMDEVRILELVVSNDVVNQFAVAKLFLSNTEEGLSHFHQVNPACIADNEIFS